MWVLQVAADKQSSGDKDSAAHVDGSPVKVLDRQIDPGSDPRSDSEGTKAGVAELLNEVIKKEEELAKKNELARKDAEVRDAAASQLQSNHAS